jgi:hypothetical protein
MEKMIPGRSINTDHLKENVSLIRGFFIPPRIGSLHIDPDDDIPFHGFEEDPEDRKSEFSEIYFVTTSII